MEAIIDFRLIVVGVFLSSYFMSCDSMEKFQEVNDDQPGHMVDRQFTSTTGKIFLVSELHPMGKSLSHIVMRSKGFEFEINDTIKSTDPISEIFMADLDSNGFEELYIVTQSAGSGSYGRIIGYSSNRDKSGTSIHVEDQDSSPSEEYSGHDRYSIGKKGLIRTYKNYTGQEGQVLYKLLKGEAGWILKPILLPESGDFSH